MSKNKFFDRLQCAVEYCKKVIDFSIVFLEYFRKIKLRSYIRRVERIENMDSQIKAIIAQLNLPT